LPARVRLVDHATRNGRAAGAGVLATAGPLGWRDSDPDVHRGDPIAMPTDHGPELAALRKRLADAKEFL
jgi:hypothetical protein